GSHADLKLTRPFNLLRPNHLEVNPALPVSHDNPVQRFQRMTDRTQPRSCRRDVQRVRQIFETLSGCVISAHFYGQHRPGTILPPLFSLYTAGLHGLPIGSVPRFRREGNGSNGWGIRHNGITAASPEESALLGVHSENAP